MIIGRLIDVTLQWPSPIRVRRVTGWICPKCDQWRHVGRDGRCGVCMTPLKRARP